MVLTGLGFGDTGDCHYLEGNYCKTQVRPAQNRSIMSEWSREDPFSWISG
jgi:hypothetical protein